MDSKNLQSDPLPNDELPIKLVERLRRTDASTPSVDPAVDRGVLEQAKAHFAGRASAPALRSRGVARRRSPRRSASVSRAGRRPIERRARWAAGVAAASVIVAALLLVRPVGWQGVAGPDDIDRSGQVDILDAFALARMRAAGRTVTQAEIDALAARVVALEPASRSRNAHY